MSAKILAIDTATEMCSVALMVGDEIFSRSEIAPRDHTKKILPMVDDVLKEAGVTLAEVDALAYGRGPGSFTGVRIGIGIAQGLALGADLPMIGISTLAAMAQGAYRLHGVENVACAIDARMNEVYWAQYQRQQDGSWITLDDECVIPPSDLAAHLRHDSNTWAQVGTGWDAYQTEMAEIGLQRSTTDVLYPESRDIAFLAKFEWQKGNTVPVEESSPVYLRDNVAWKKLPGRE